MPVKIIITGENGTEALAQLSVLANALSNNESPFCEPEEGIARARILAEKGMREQTPKCADTQIQHAQYGCANDPAAGEPSIVKWARSPDEQEKPKRTRKRKSTEEGVVLDHVSEERTVNNDILEKVTVTDRFGDSVVHNDAVGFPITGIVEATVVADDVQEELVITIDSFKALIQEKAVGSDGKDDPVKYTAILKLVREAVPVGIKASVSNIPADKLPELYYEVAAL